MIVYRYYGDEESAAEEEEFASSDETSDSSNDELDKVNIDVGRIGCLLMKIYCR